jgi:hypothetical protein
MKPPLSGDESLHSRFTRRKTEPIGFAPEESGITAYFCVRFCAHCENGKGEKGKWVPVASAIIP